MHSFLLTLSLLPSALAQFTTGPTTWNTEPETIRSIVESSATYVVSDATTTWPYVGPVEVVAESSITSTDGGMTRPMAGTTTYDNGVVDVWSTGPYGSYNDGGSAAPVTSGTGGGTTGTSTPVTSSTNGGITSTSTAPVTSSTNGGITPSTPAISGPSTTMRASSGPAQSASSTAAPRPTGAAGAWGVDGNVMMGALGIAAAIVV